MLFTDHPIAIIVLRYEKDKDVYVCRPASPEADILLPADRIHSTGGEYEKESVLCAAQAQEPGEHETVVVTSRATPQAEDGESEADSGEGTAPATPKKEWPDEAGVCRICGCTDEMPCILDDGDACEWTDGAATLCTNPRCIAAADREAAQPPK